MTDRRYSTGATLPDGRPSGLRLINTHRDISASHARKLVQVIATYYGAPEVPEVIETISGWSGKPIWELSFDRPVTDTRDLWTTHLWRAAGDASRYTLTHTEH